MAGAQCVAWGVWGNWAVCGQRRQRLGARCGPAVAGGGQGKVRVKRVWKCTNVNVEGGGRCGLWYKGQGSNCMYEGQGVGAGRGGHPNVGCGGVSLGTGQVGQHKCMGNKLCVCVGTRSRRRQCWHPACRTFGMPIQRVLPATGRTRGAQSVVVPRHGPGRQGVCVCNAPVNKWGKPAGGPVGVGKGRWLQGKGREAGREVQTRCGVCGPSPSVGVGMITVWVCGARVWQQAVCAR